MTTDHHNSKSRRTIRSLWYYCRGDDAARGGVWCGLEEAGGILGHDYHLRGPGGGNAGLRWLQSLFSCDG